MTEPTTDILVPPALYVPRVRLWGNMQWICPYCGNYTVSRLTMNNYRMICSGTGCHHRYVPGTVLYPISRGRFIGKATPPPDWVIPADYELDGGLREAFPTGDLSRVTWRRHNPTHVLVDPQSSDFNVGLLVKSARRLAETAQGCDFGGELGVVSAGGGGIMRLARLGAAFETLTRIY